MYDYQKEKPWLFEDKGFAEFLKARDYVMVNYKSGRLVTRDAFFNEINQVVSVPSSFSVLAIIDRLVELGEFKQDSLKSSGSVVLIRKY